jgi:MFS family permease
VSGTARAIMLAALCLGVLLVGVELFITAVALPRIIVDLSGWTDLRRASWIITAYLIAYIAATPLAGRAADRFGLPALMMGSLALFAAGSLLAGSAQSLELLVVARAIQGAGAGAIVPLATAGASHLYTGHARSRALGFVGAATFLGMALGPLLGAVALQGLELRDPLAALGIWGGPLVDLLAPSWRWVFYLTVPLSILALIYVWAASPGWDVKPGRASMDTLGAILFSVALTSGLLAITLLGEQTESLPLVPVAAVIALLAGALAAWRMLRTPEPFLDLRLFGDRVFSGAVLVSLLTGYALATAIVGVATFIDRVRFQGPEEQGILLGPLALAMAVGAFVSGFAVRRIDATLVTLVGLAASIAGLLVLSTVRIDTELAVPLAAVSLFGLGFGLTVTPRTTAAVEAAGRAAFGMASGIVTVARMVGMGLGMAILTAFATTRIDAVSRAIEDQAFRDSILPPDLVGAPLGDPLVLDALEHWASGEAAQVLGQLFIVAAGVLLVTAVPAWLMRSPSARRVRRSPAGGARGRPAEAGASAGLPDAAGGPADRDEDAGLDVEAGDDAGDAIATGF